MDLQVNKSNTFVSGLGFICNLIWTITMAVGPGFT